MSLKERVYVKRAQRSGPPRADHHPAHPPAGRPAADGQHLLTIAIAIYLETALAFLGLEDPTVTTWGTILEHAFERTAISSGAWWAIVPDGFVIAFSSSAASCSGSHRGRAEPAAEGAHLSVRRWRIRPLAGRGRGDMSLLEVSDLHVWFDLPQGQQVHAVQGVSFALDPGDRSGWSVSPGCGKTTTILP